MTEAQKASLKTPEHVNLLSEDEQKTLAEIDNALLDLFNAHQAKNSAFQTSKSDDSNPLNMMNSLCKLMESHDSILIMLVKKCNYLESLFKNSPRNL